MKGRSPNENFAHDVLRMYVIRTVIKHDFLRKKKDVEIIMLALRTPLNNHDGICKYKVHTKFT